MVTNTFATALHLGLALSALAWPARAQTNQPPIVPDRYLLLLDVSAPMRPRALEVQNAITRMLVSGMQGQIKDGDEIGIWTFNDQLHTGEFELIKWQEADRNDITRRVLEFIKTRRYENQTRFEHVRPELAAVVAESRRITVILISDGDEVIQGTPFDLMITRYFQENGEKLKDLKTPIITIMRGYKGQWVSHTISYSPWPMEFPFFPSEPEPEEKSKEHLEPRETAKVNSLSRTLVTTNKGPIVYAEPLIVRGPRRDAPETSPTVTQTDAVMVVEPLDAGTKTQPPTPGNNVAGRTTEQPLTAEVPDELLPGVAFGSSPEIQNPMGTAEETSPTRLWSPAKFILVGLLSLVVVSGGMLLLRKKPHSRGHTSLITRSMDKKNPKR